MKEQKKLGDVSGPSDRSNLEQFGKPSLKTYVPACYLTLSVTSPLCCNLTSQLCNLTSCTSSLFSFEHHPKPMKSFLGIQKRQVPAPEKHESSVDVAAVSSHSESDSIKDLQPMFELHPSSKFHDPYLNLDPYISQNTSTTTSVKSAVGHSVFSSTYSASSKHSSYASNFSHTKKSRPSEYGQPLQILDIPEEPRSEMGVEPSRVIEDRLHSLWQDVSYILNQYATSVDNLSTAVVNIIDRFKEFRAFVDCLDAPGGYWSFTTYNNDDVRKLMRAYLHYYDNLLQDEAYIRLKLLLCRSFNDFCLVLKSSLRSQSSVALEYIQKPRNYAIGVNDGQELPHQDAVARIVFNMANSLAGLKEQNGSFIAPIARGIDKDMNVLCLYFGYPAFTADHKRAVSGLLELFDDVHFMANKNRIDLAAATAQRDSLLSTMSPHNFKLPFRTPTDPLCPPMSLSLSVDTSRRISGTMGGFIYPKIDVKTLPLLASYATSKFALSCGHVCLNKSEDFVEYPHVSSPLSVLINLYKEALAAQYNKLEGENAGMDSKAAYGLVLKQIDEIFPLKEVTVVDSKTKQKRTEVRNLPPTKFGQIIWGERALIEAENDKGIKEFTDKRLSDLAIIKVNKELRCDQNYLGDDIAFNEYDPALFFDNLYVRKVINLHRYTKEYSMENVNEVDSVDSLGKNSTTNGLPVFKYGSTTKFTRGNLNGIKLVYWLDGAIHSSEFVVNSEDSTSYFAAGGDSGSWILSKLEDVKGVLETKGLGVVGMLHSYDGEFRQFGLFTPMAEILNRLEKVTKIQWGVVGVSEKGEEEVESTDSESRLAFSSDDTDDSEYESGLEEQTSLPEID